MRASRKVMLQGYQHIPGRDQGRIEGEAEVLIFCFQADALEEAVHPKRRKDRPPERRQVKGLLFLHSPELAVIPHEGVDSEPNRQPNKKIQFHGALPPIIFEYLLHPNEFNPSVFPLIFFVVFVPDKAFPSCADWLQPTLANSLSNQILHDGFRPVFGQGKHPAFRTILVRVNDNKVTMV